MTKRKPEGTPRKVRSDIRISPKAHPLVRRFLEEMLANDFGYTAFGLATGISAATLQGWARGKTPTLPDLVRAYAFLGLELWPVRVQPTKIHREAVRRMFGTEDPCSANVGEKPASQTRARRVRTSGGGGRATPAPSGSTPGKPDTTLTPANDQRMPGVTARTT